MTIQEFVETAVGDFIDGLSSLRTKFPDHDIATHIQLDSRGSQGFMPLMGGYTASVIDFDLAVTVTSETSAKGGGKINVLSLGAAGSEMQASKGNEFSSRVKFRIPVSLEPRIK